VSMAASSCQLSCKLGTELSLARFIAKTAKLSAVRHLLEIQLHCETLLFELYRQPRILDSIGSVPGRTLAAGPLVGRPVPTPGWAVCVRPPDCGEECSGILGGLLNVHVLRVQRLALMADNIIVVWD
jgi:hypothetical protein